MLVRAVIECGCAWDNVARLCPTRAYHQVRQRFLRGLKSGHALPPELMHLQPQLLQSVQDHATKRCVSVRTVGAISADSSRTTGNARSLRSRQLSA